MPGRLIVLFVAVFVSFSVMAGQPVPFRLTDGDVEKLDEIVAKTVPPDVRAKFDSLYADWPKVRGGMSPPTLHIHDVLTHWDPHGPGVKPPLSSDSFDYVRTKEYRELRRMGRAILPLLAQKMAKERDPYSAFRLYVEIQENPYLFPNWHSLDRDPASPARRLAGQWLDEQIRQENAMNPADFQALDEICRKIPEPVRKEFTWRFRDWRVARADEIRRDVAAADSECGSDLEAMGEEIVPLLLRKIATAPGGWRAIPLFEKIKQPVAEQDEPEHPQAHAVRVVKQWLAANGGVRDASGRNAPGPGSEFCHFPVSSEDLAEIRRRAEAVPSEKKELFRKEFAVWQLSRAPKPEALDAWWEILTGGQEVDALGTLGRAGMTLLVREMAEDPNAGFLLPLYNALQTDRALLPQFPDARPGPAAPCGRTPTARLTAKIWLDVHREPAADEMTRQLGSPLGPVPHLPAVYARRLLEVVRDIPDAFKKGFGEDYALWRLHAWGLVPASSPARKQYVTDKIAGRVKFMGHHAIPLMMERIAFDPDGAAAAELLRRVSPGDAEAAGSDRPWLAGNLPIVRNWLENNTNWHRDDQNYALRERKTLNNMTVVSSPDMFP